MSELVARNLKFLATSSLIDLPVRIFSAFFFAIFDVLLGFRPLGQALFDRVANRENVTQVLRRVYVRKDAVDGELVDGVLAPAGDPGALDVFVNILTGDPGKTADELLPQVLCPIRFIWGD